jgi:ATP-dependent Lon protease
MNPIVQTLQTLQTKVTTTVQLPTELRQKALEQISRSTLSLQYGGSLAALEITEKYIDFICRLPWQTRTDDRLDISIVRQILDKRHYGLEKIKKRIEEYLASMIMIKKQNPDAILRAPSLFFTGLAGTGKTSFAPMIAEALGRKFYRIPFGGLANALDLRGQTKSSPYAQPGVIMRALAECGTRNPVILLDEIDRANPTDRAPIMGALLEILDPGQNHHFTDYFVDYPFDLSQVMFIATSNNSKDISILKVL